ncbi:MAG TPA: enoyl-CoA hydratase/isomerase family protein [Kofleriaceae bacterium]|nr:enoyl-CoA hydratase/isomerase family protein [Kofleriaceae bacterium]
MIRAESGPGVLTIALERPEAKNALDLDMVRELRLALSAVTREVRAVVLRSAVPGVFSLGMDLAALQGGIAAGASSPEVHAAAAEYVGLLKDLTALRAISIAEVDGLAIGGGVDLLASCDLVIASERSAFSIAQLRKGIFPLTTSGVVVPRIGHREFLYWMLSGQNYSADKARRLGLVSQVVPHGDLGARVAGLVERILSYEPEAVRLGIEALRVGPSLPLAERLDHLGALLALNCQIPRGAR